MENMIENNFDLKTELNESVNPVTLTDIENLKIKNEYINLICNRKNKNIKLQNIFKYPQELNSISEKIECLCLRFNNTDNQIAAGYNTGHTIIYDINRDIHMFLSNTNASINTLRWKPNTLNYGKDILLTASTEGELTYWHTSTGKILHKIEEYGCVFLSLDYSVDGNLFAVGAEDKILRIFDDNMKMVTTKFMSGSNYSPGHKSRINSVCFHKNDSTGCYTNLLVSGGWDQRIIIYDIRTKNICGTIFGPYICGDSIDMKDHNLLTGSYYPESNVELWDLRNYKLLDPLTLCQNDLNVNIYSAQFNKVPGSNLIGMGGSTCNCFRLYDVDLKEPKNNSGMSPYISSRYLDKPCYTLDFANNKCSVAFGGGDGKIRIVDYM